jgi:hypothetical protein
VIPEPTPEQIAALKAKLIEITDKPRGFNDDQITTIFKLLKFNLKMKNVGKLEFINIIQKSGIDSAKIVRSLGLYLHQDRCNNPELCRIIFDRIMAMIELKFNGGNVNLQNIYNQVVPVEAAPAPEPAAEPAAEPVARLENPAGGRRKTSSWRRSKPARYTRRKF